MASTERGRAWTATSGQRSRFRNAVLGVLVVTVSSVVDRSLLGAEPVDSAVQRVAIPNAQVGSLFPLLQATAGRSTLELSFLHDRFQDVQAWKREAQPKLLSLLHYSPPKCDPRAEVVERVDCGDYIREKLYFHTTPDIRVPAYLLLPKGEAKQRPAIVALHDHGAFFAWGKEKLIATDHEHPALTEFKRTAYSGRSFGSELAKRGYVVIAIDMFYWGERRMLLPNDPPAWRDPDQLSLEDVAAFHRRCSASTSLIATGLFEAGITWSGVMFLDDIRTVDYLATRPEVDPERIGCCGLSVGGFRSAHLAGLDSRIKAAVVVGWMSTYGSMLQNKLTSIGFMKVIPGLYQYMDLPDVVSLTVPGGLMVINGTQDQLFPLAGVQASFAKIAAVYQKAGVPERFQGVTYDGPHEFNAQMQDKAFAWLDRWLKP
ncbi:MAG: acetylxylan esterase [Planctomycetota bacterium]|nr:acetylxylan esterase [Planctomycetota bacterium]